MIDFGGGRLDAQIVEIIVAVEAAHREHEAAVCFDDEFADLAGNDAVRGVADGREHRQHALADVEAERAAAALSDRRRGRGLDRRSLRVVVHRVIGVLRIAVRVRVRR